MVIINSLHAYKYFLFIYIFGIILLYAHIKKHVFLFFK